MPPDALRAALSDPTVLPADWVALPEDHPAWKALRPLGYQVSRWLKAMTALRTRFHKQRLPEPVLAFLAHWVPEETPAEVPADTFALLLGRRGLRLQVHAGPHASIGNPRWWALLGLPGLRDFWIAELRGSHYAHLLERVPHAWCMDPAPLPPGSVIAGLDLADWLHLPQWREQDRCFVIHRGTGETTDLSPQLAAGSWLAHIESALSARDSILVEETGVEEWLLARYGRSDDEIMLADAFTSI